MIDHILVEFVDKFCKNMFAGLVAVYFDQQPP